MAKKKAKITKLQDYQKKDPLYTARQDGVKMLSDGEDPYIVALSLLLKRVHMSLEKNEKNVSDYFEKYELHPFDTINLISNEVMDHNLASYDMLIMLMYLFTSPKGRSEFTKIVDWLPLEAEKEVVRQWQEDYVFSIFQPKNVADELHFTDLRDGKDYATGRAYGSSLVNEGKNVDELRFMLTLLPLPDGSYLTSPGTFCEMDLQFQKALSSKLTKPKFAEKLLSLYREYLEVIADELDVDEDDYLEDGEDYYPMTRYTNESDRHYAKRLLEQSDELDEFPDVKMMEDLLVKVVKKFPQLILPRANAMSLVEGVIEVFTSPDDDDDPELDALMGDDLSHFWYLLIIQHFPSEVKKIRQMMKDSGFFDETDIDDDDLWY